MMLFFGVAPAAPFLRGNSNVQVLIATIIFTLGLIIGICSLFWDLKKKH